MTPQLHPLKIAEVRRETADAISITFEVPPLLADVFEYEHGQYITLETELKGEKVRRAYSMSSSPVEGALTVSVKRIKGGVMSNHLNDTAKAGETLQVMPPQGRFTAPLDAAKYRSFYLLGGGSGITPLFSIIKTVLEKEPKSSLFLLYGNYDEDSIIFKTQLEDLQRRYEGQLFVEHILSDPKQDKTGGGMFGFMKKSTSSWTGLVGVPDQKAINAWLDRNPASTAETVFFTCGPLPMMRNLEAVVAARGIDKKQFHMEVFSSATEQKEGAAAAALVHTGASMAAVKLNGKKFEVPIAAGQTILDSLLKAGYDAPFSCKSGACSTCIAKLNSGKVEMDACFALNDDEVADGYILACTARPTTAAINVDFDA